MKVIKLNSSNKLTEEEIVNIRGGINSSLVSETECTCDCWFSNENTSPPKKKVESIQGE